MHVRAACQRSTRSSNSLHKGNVRRRIDRVPKPVSTSAPQMSSSWISAAREEEVYDGYTILATLSDEDDTWCNDQERVIGYLSAFSTLRPPGKGSWFSWSALEVQLIRWRSSSTGIPSPSGLYRDQPGANRSALRPEEVRSGTSSSIGRLST